MPVSAEPGLFERTFGRQAERAYWSPGRVNLMGEHTDYTGGLVLPMAIEQGTRFEAAPRTDRTIHVHSEAFGETWVLERSQLAEGPRGHWSDYLLGVLQAFGEPWPEQGFDLCITADLPSGCGLSSSASLTVGFAGVVNDMANRGLDRLELVHIAQAAENEFVGLACGILDPFAVAMGQKDHVLALDCSSLEWATVPLPSDRFHVLLADTGVTRTLANSSYNERRKECERAERWLDVPLRQLTLAELEGGAPPAHRLREQNVTAYRRARHVVSENERVRSARSALEDEKMDRFGALMNASHQSLRDDYAVSCPELDMMVTLLRRQDGVVGAKMTGAGFGGAVVALVDIDHLDRVRATLPDEYAAQSGRQATLMTCRPSAGFSRVA